uniref:zinc finger protein 85-like isoform X1 n=1 Tax=Myxine glutinosa TaxID=7769 RepID=UPI00358FCE7E
MLCFLCLCSIGSLVHVTNAEVMEGFEILKIKIEDVNYLGPEEERGKKEDDLFVNLKVKTEQDIDENLDIPQTKAFHNQSNRQYEEILAKVKTEPDTFVDTEVQETKVYPNIKLESDHCQGEQQNVQKIPFGRCCLKFASEDALQLHLKMHHEISVEAMNKYLNGRLITDLKDNFNSHLKMHAFKQDQNERPQTSMIGAESSTNQQQPGKSYKKRPYKCKICGKSFQHEWYLKKHVMYHGTVLLHKCSNCEKSFNCTSSLTVHMKIHSTNGSYKCTTCGKAFNSSSSLQNHMPIHSAERPYKCTTCGSSFFRPTDLKNHTIIHTDYRPHKCEICEKSFIWQSVLKKHLQIHIASHKCELCEKSFTRLSYLNIHRRIHIRKYKCEICEKCFDDQPDLTTHLQVHSGGHPYKCTTCGKAFNHPANAGRHMKLSRCGHQNKCKTCGKSFTRATYLRKHLIIHPFGNNEEKVPGLEKLIK